MGKDYSDVLDVTVDLWRTRGIAGFFDGRLPAITTVIVELSIEFLIYYAIVAIDSAAAPGQEYEEDAEPHPGD